MKRKNLDYVEVDGRAALADIIHYPFQSEHINTRAALSPTGYRAKRVFPVTAGRIAMR